jgi:cation diffusion facilitator family transporter
MTTHHQPDDPGRSHDHLHQAQVNPDAHDETKVVTTDRGSFEVSIFEEGVPPRFRIRFFDEQGNPRAPSDRNVVTIETQRDDGTRHSFTFVDRDAKFLEATDELPEPHEFNAVVVMAQEGHADSFELQYREHEHESGHVHSEGRMRSILHELNPFHSHEHALETDAQLESSAKGIRAVQISLLLLGLTAAFQVVVVVASGSVALFADTIHNFTDALTALPLWLAFLLGRRPSSRRYSHGFGRAEDLAGVVIVLIITASGVVAGYEAYRKLVDPEPLSHIEWVMAAGLIGFLGNEAVAVLRIRVGKEIGSAALVADGHHARVDGLTSLAVLVGAAGVLAGFERADPIVGLLIMAAIIFIVKDAAVMVWHRLMDAVDPDLARQLEQAAERAIDHADKAEGINSLRLRWVGHKLQAEINLIVDGGISTRESHALADEVRAALFSASSYVASVIVHVEPQGHGDEHGHSLTLRHS